MAQGLTAVQSAKILSNSWLCQLFFSATKKLGSKKPKCPEFRTQKQCGNLEKNTNICENHHLLLHLIFSRLMMETSLIYMWGGKWDSDCFNIQTQNRFQGWFWYKCHFTQIPFAIKFLQIQPNNAGTNTISISWVTQLRVTMEVFVTIAIIKGDKKHN